MQMSELGSPERAAGWIILNMLRIRLRGLFHNIKINCFILIFLAYAPGVFKESFWSDDYPALMDTPGFAQHVLRDGRPTAAGIFSISFSLLGDPTNAWILRSFALIALLLIFLFLSNRIGNSKHRNTGIFSMAIAFCLPSFQMYVHWSLTWLFLWAALAGLYSYHYWSSRQILKRVLAVLLLVCALTVYPPTALFFFAALVVLSALNESTTPKLVSDLRQASTLLMISGILAGLIVFVSLQIAGVSANKRVSILTASDIPEKFVWILSRPIVVGFRPFMVDSPTPIAALLTGLPVMAIVFFGIWKQSKNLKEPIFIRFFWFSLAFAFSLLPIIMTADNQIEFRVIPGYCWGIAVLAVFFLSHLIDNSLRKFIRNSKIQNFLLALTPLTLSLLAIISINLHYSELFGSPYQKKNAFLNTSLTTCSNEGKIKNILILSPDLPFPSRPRLGVFSMSTDLGSNWVPKPNVELLLEKMGIESTVQYLELRPNLADMDTAACIIDLEEFRKSLK
jgi:hypothetical protein